MNARNVLFRREWCIRFQRYCTTRLPE
jgi:hypothetical protein